MDRVANTLFGASPSIAAVPAHEQPISVERGLPVGANGAELPSRYACLAGRIDIAAVIGGYLSVLSRPEQQLHPAAVQAGVNTISVELDLMQPSGPRGGASTSLQSCGLTHFGRPANRLSACRH
jgi:hypothetical protein